MYPLHDYYPFFWSLLLVIAVFIVVMLDIMQTDYDERTDDKRTELRDKLHYCIMQNRGWLL